MESEKDANSETFMRLVLADLHRGTEPASEVLCSHLEDWRATLIRIIQDTDTQLADMKARAEAGEPPLWAKRKSKLHFKSFADRRLREVKAMLLKEKAMLLKENVESSKASNIHDEVKRQGVLLRAIAEKLGIHTDEKSEGKP